MDTTKLRDPRERFIFQGGSEYALSLADEIDRLRAENAMLRTGDTCARQCEGAAWRIEAQRLKREVDALRTERQWRPIETAPKDTSVLLKCAGTGVPAYCGRYRHGNLDEPQQNELAWRCDSSGRFANPTHWMPLPAPPKGDE